MLVRAAAPADVPAVLPLVRALCDLHARQDPHRFQVRADVLDRYAAWLPERARDPRSVFLVGEAPATAPGGTPRVVAFLVGTVEPEIPIWWVPECGWIHDVWVEPDCRRHGVARALVERAVERFAALGVAQVRLDTAAFNDAARAVFASAGFRPCVVEMIRTLREPPANPPHIP